MGEALHKVGAGQNGAIALDTFGGRIHVEWDPAVAVTPLGQLPFFIEFLKVSGLFETWVADCPLTLCLNPPEHALVLSVDEKSQIQALDRTQPGLPMKKGHGGTMTHDYL